jgi:hypothetical protein
VVGVAGAGHRWHAHVEGEPEGDLADCPTMMLADASQFGTAHRLAVGGRQRQTLVDESVRYVELPNSTVPAPLGVAAILDEAGTDTRLAAESSELLQGDIPHSMQTGAAALLDGLHRPPRFPIDHGQAEAPGLAHAVNRTCSK